MGRIALCTTHDTCSAFLKDHDTFVRDPANAGKMTQARILRLLPRTLSLLALNMLGHDDPEHRRLRGLVDTAFQRRSIEAIGPIITDVADRLLDRMKGSQTGRSDGRRSAVTFRSRSFASCSGFRIATTTASRLARRAEGHRQHLGGAACHSRCHQGGELSQDDVAAREAKPSRTD